MGKRERIHVLHGFARIPNACVDPSVNQRRNNFTVAPMNRAKQGIPFRFTHVQVGSLAKKVAHHLKMSIGSGSMQRPTTCCPTTGIQVRTQF